jgi:hypothetical protein
LSELEQLATRYGFISNGKMIEEIEADTLHENCKKHVCVKNAAGTIGAGICLTFIAAYSGIFNLGNPILHRPLNLAYLGIIIAFFLVVYFVSLIVFKQSEYR